jgi:hypothetical protein
LTLSFEISPDLNPRHRKKEGNPLLAERTRFGPKPRDRVASARCAPLFQAALALPIVLLRVIDRAGRQTTKARSFSPFATIHWSKNLEALVEVLE